MSPPTAVDEPATAASFEVYQVLPRQSLFRRFLTTQRHLFGLVFGAHKAQALFFTQGRRGI